MSDRIENTNRYGRFRSAVQGILLYPSMDSVITRSPDERAKKGSMIAAHCKKKSHASSLKIRISYFTHEYSSRYEKTSSAAKERCSFHTPKRGLKRSSHDSSPRQKPPADPLLCKISVCKTLSKSSHSTYKVLIGALFFPHRSESPLRLYSGVLS